MKILITGGHVTPAAAAIEELQKRGAVEIVFVGRGHTYEYRLITDKYHLPFFHLDAGRLSRYISIRSFMNILKIPKGFFEAYRLVSTLKCDAVLSFGGYIALPIAFAAFLRGIPVYTHEQTLIPGLANRIIAQFAKKVFISFPETKKVFDQKKTILTGNPIRPAVFEVKKALFAKTKPVLYIAGGSLGSHTVNSYIEQLLPRLLKKFIVVHQTGNEPPWRDFDRLSNLKYPDYYVFSHIFDEDIGFVYAMSDAYIGRSGVNTIFELIALKKPSILIPLALSASGEQEAHARFLKKHGVCELFSQKEKVDVLYQLIEAVFSRKEIYIHNFRTLARYYIPNAAYQIAHEIFSTL
ncbi:MAG TPA: UDP-N-acetylglucosamine--N-acetylmuramyl-(pentapeptide) pyrophosphoryl-undecaprenol N-acetylglucosamine transferase [Patescibacteria group bacterium]|nr:UDP-N-acetylglucosamine--N-acetylmuramyl-(pentapeptide) pyrophosphoryl-undecaprenol N-acetylglucosamine transferase [Patescibacteria group bacterium]